VGLGEARGIDPRRLKRRLQVTYIDAGGRQEAGVDGGGLFKDFMDSLTRRAFDPRCALFRETPKRCLYPSPDSKIAAGPEHLEHFEFLGQVLGKALYEGILVDPRLARFFLNKLLGKHNLVDELQSLDPALYRSLMFMKDYEPASAVEDLAIYFVAPASRLGALPERPLILGGADVAVTADNRIEYIVRIANYKLNVEIAPQCAAFLKGLRVVVPQRWLSMFSSDGLQRLIGGSDEHIDVDDMERYTRLTGGYDRSLAHPRVNGRWFFETVRELTHEEIGRLLKFATSCSRPPLLGFKEFHPPFTVQRVNITNDNERLPTGSTCFNTLKLPTYSSRAVLKAKLLLVIAEGEGFELT
jgi:ubiquitin-protein ligase E3 C